MQVEILLQPTSPTVVVTAESLGLGSVDNTSDADKPVSTAQAAANAADRARANHTGTQAAATISDFATAVGLLITGKADVTVTDSLASDIATINALLASDDVSLDELQEIVTYIKANRADIDALGISSITGLQTALDQRILATSGAPDNAEGADGSYAIDVVAQIAYGPKSAGVWPAGVSFTGAAPYLSVDYSGIRIDINSTTTTLNTGTLFDDTIVGEQSSEHTFTLTNRGAADITLTSNPVSVTGEFTVVTQPTELILAPDEAETFVIRFDPVTEGLLNGTVSIASDDPSRNPFDFAVSGTGIASAVILGDPAGGAGYGIAAPTIPAGFEAVDAAGYVDKNSQYFGNLRHINSSSIGVVKPAMVFKAGAGVNEWESAYLADFPDLATAEADGWWLHEAFYAGGTELDPDVAPFLLVDKYLASKVSVGTGFVAASIKDGNPLSTASTHNPIADITACSGVNFYYAAVRAPKGRDSANGEYDPISKWYCTTRQIQGLMLLLSQCHGHAATSTTHCAWYDATGTINFPKGCDNNALGSVDDGALSWVSDGYSNAVKTGSCNDPAKTSINGQLCDVMEMGGNMFQINLGMTRASDQVAGDTNHMVLKKHISPADLDWGEGGAEDAWGTTAELSGRYDAHDFPALTNASAWMRFGNGANQVLDTVDAKAASVGLPTAVNAISSGGSTEYGNDGLYLYHRAALCALSGLRWSSGSIAGVGAVYLSHERTKSYDFVGFRAACALDI